MYSVAPSRLLVSDLLPNFVFAISAPQRIGYAIAVIAFVALLAFFVIQLNRSKGGSDYAANRVPFYNDELLETKRLDRVLAYALVMLIVSAIGLPLYWAREPGRQVGEIARFDEEAVKRGFQIFQSTASPAEPGGQQPYGCAGCHGSVGQGGVAAYSVKDPTDRTKSVQWQAPAVNVAFQRYRESEVHYILVYGRQGKPMPAWGAAGGGPMSEQQITDVMAYLSAQPNYKADDAGVCKPNIRTGIELSEMVYVDPATGAIPSENFNEDCTFKPFADQNDFGAKTTQAKFPATKAYQDALNAAQSSVDADNKPVVTPSSGQLLFQTNCARCHTKGFSYGQPEKMGAGWFGPNLTGGSELRQFTDRKAQITFITEGAEEGKNYGTGGISHGLMPHFSNVLSEDQISDIVDYARGL